VPYELLALVNTVFYSMYYGLVTQMRRAYSSYFLVRKIGLQ